MPAIATRPACDGSASTSLATGGEFFSAANFHARDAERDATPPTNRSPTDADFARTMAETAMHPDKAELFAPSWTAAALRHQLAFLKVALLKDTADKTRDELVELYWEALVARGVEHDAEARRWLLLPEELGPEEQAEAWVCLLADRPLEATPLQERLKSGTMLCALLEKVKPGSIKLKVASDAHLATLNENMANAKMRENIGQYVDGCADLGLPQRELFLTAVSYTHLTLPTTPYV